MNFFRIYLVLFFVGTALTTFGQNDYRTPVIGPSPTSYAFTMYGNNQPSLQSGNIDIPIPLFEVKAPGISIPLNIRYHTAGINLMDSPYPLGYGWNFSAGYRITRTVLGRPDDRFEFKQLYGGEEYQTTKKGILDEQIANTHGLSSDDLYDTQKDIFTLSLPSGNFKFVLVRTGNVYEAVTIGHQIKIELIHWAVPDKSNAYILGFKVADQNGLVYIFGDDVYQQTLSDYKEFVGGTGVTTTWALKEITLLNNEKIKYSWIKRNTNGMPVQTDIPISVVDYKNWDCDVGNYEVIDIGGKVDYFSSTYVEALMLKKIEYPSGTVELNYKLGIDPMLQTITVKDKLDNTIRSVNFTYGANNLQQDHLLLQSLNVNGEVYRFQYDSHRFYKNATGLDYWGYYNGKDNNYTLLPKMGIKIRSHISFPVNMNLPPDTYLNVGHADRSISEEHMMAFILNKIYYPTGGYSEYEYETHEFPGHSVHSVSTDSLFIVEPEPIKFGGGLRVSKIKTYSSPNENPIIKTYKYGVNENGLANNSVVPTLDTFINEYWEINQNPPGPNNCVNAYWRTRRVMNINALSNYSKFLVYENPIWYSQVTEYVNDELKTQYNFSLEETYNLTWGLNAKSVKSPYRFRYDNLFNEGAQLISTTFFKKKSAIYEPVKKEENIYEVVDPSVSIPSAIIDRNLIYNTLIHPGPDLYPYSFYGNSGGIPTDGYSSFSPQYNIFLYNISVKYNRLKRSIVKEYYGTDTLSNYKDFFYNDPQLIRTEERTSIDQRIVATDYKYPGNYSEPVYQAMVAKNILSPVIEKKVSVNGNMVNLEKNNYTNAFAISNGLILPYLFEMYDTQTNTKTAELSINKYDNQGNILELRAKAGIPVSYLWSYKSQYPIAEIKNAEYATIVNILGQTAIDSFAASNPGYNEVNNFLLALRNNNLLKDAQITSFTYKPLVGMSSQTDAKGQTTYYEYDASQRLKFIKDQYGNIVKNFTYKMGQAEITYYSSQKSQNFTKECTTGQGSEVLYVVSAGKYSSVISQADADNQALADIAENGQNYANTNGTCTIPYVDVEIQKITDWNGTISRIQFYKDGGSSSVYEVFPTNSGSSEIISIPEGEYSSIKFTIDGSGTPYNGMLSVVNSNSTVCAQVGMSSTIISLSNVKFTASGNKLIVIAEYCMN